MKNFALPVLLAAILASCQSEKLKTVDAGGYSEAEWAVKTTLKLPDEAADYNRQLPDWMVKMELKPAPVDNKKATIGRVLFYDKNLSANGKVSCASCHQQAHGFADTEAKSFGVAGFTNRNAPSLANSPSSSAYHGDFKGKKIPFFWDGRAASVAEQSRQTLHNPVEMGISAEEAADIVRGEKYYELLWQKTYGHFQPTADQLLECLSEFVGAIGASNSRFDRGMRLKTDALGSVTVVSTAFDTVVLVPAYYDPTDTITIINTTFTYGNIFPLMTGEESVGKDIFIKNCSKGHSPARTFQEVFEACNGLDENYADNGIGALTGKPTDNGVFQSPSLKNIALTAPYMHDGRFQTLEQVVEFYSEGIQPHKNLHPLMKLPTGLPNNLHLSYQEKVDLVAFLKTLTDDDAQTDARFSNPFR